MKKLTLTFHIMDDTDPDQFETELGEAIDEYCNSIEPDEDVALKDCPLWVRISYKKSRPPTSQRRVAPKVKRQKNDLPKKK